MDLAESLGLAPAEERDAAGRPLLEEGEELLQAFSDVQLVIGADADQGAGTLYLLSGRIVWLSGSDPKRGYGVDFTAISLHAISSDPESFNRPCLYLQLDVGEEEGFGGEEEEEEEGEEEAPLPELRLIPADPTALEPMFAAFCEGAERNPDAAEGDDEAGGGGFFYDEDEVLAGAAAAAFAVADADELAGGDPGRFGDAEDEEEEEEAALQPNGR